MWVLTLSEHPLPLLQWGTVIGASLAAAFSDARTRRIPNLLTGPLYLGGLASAFCFAGPSGLADGFAASLLLAFPFILLFAFAGGGAGDAKLMGGIGAWLGLANGLAAMFAVALTGVVLAVVFATKRSLLGQTFVRIAGVVRGTLLPVFTRGSIRPVADVLPIPDDGQKMPYGLAIALGTTFAAVGTLLWNA